MDTSWIAWAVAIVATLLFLRERRLRREGGDGSPQPHGSTRAEGAPQEVGTYTGDPTERSPVDKVAEGEPASQGGPRWVSAGETVTVAGRQIGGMVYVGQAATTGAGREADRRID